MSLVSQIERLSKLIEHKKQNTSNHVEEVVALITEQTCELCYIPEPNFCSPEHSVPTVCNELPTEPV